MSTTSKERPILFSAPMVRAILEGRKTQTRRVVKGITDPESFEVLGDSGAGFLHSDKCQSFCDYACGGKEVECPYGKPGDRLWVRESARIIGMGINAKRHYIDYRAGGLVACDSLPYKHACAGMFYAPGETETPEPDDKGRYVWPWKTRSSIPRWASRITLEITGVRVERLQSISEADAIAEACEPIEVSDADVRQIVSDRSLDSNARSLAKALGAGRITAKGVYSSLWDDIHGAGAWALNPWVWVVEVRRVES